MNFDGRLFFAHIYIDVQIFIEKFKLKQVLTNPFVKIIVLWQAIACYKCTPKDYCTNFVT
jgi:hypothetical protein